LDGCHSGARCCARCWQMGTSWATTPGELLTALRLPAGVRAPLAVWPASRWKAHAMWAHACITPAHVWDRQRTWQGEPAGFLQRGR
jgi:hypothetical protein